MAPIDASAGWSHRKKGKMWYLVKKKTKKRWRAYKLEEKPELKRDYEMRGPYKSLFACWVAEDSNFTVKCEK